MRISDWSSDVCSSDLAVSSPANAADTVVWNFSLWGPPRAVTAAADLLAETVAEKTAGNFTIRLHYGEAVSPAKENLDSIKMGAVEIAMICTAYHRRSEEHTSELQSLMRISYAVSCLKKKKYPYT